MNLDYGEKNYLIPKKIRLITSPIKFLISKLQDNAHKFNFLNFMNANYDEDKFLNLINFNKLSKSYVLDFGSGLGYYSNFFDQNYYYGVEPNKNYYKISKKNYPNKNFFNLNFAKENPPNLFPKFQLILINGVIHHINDNDCDIIMPKLKKLLSNNGHMLVREPLPPQSLLKFKSLIYKNLDLGNYIRIKSELLKIFKNFKIIKMNFDIRSEHIELILK